MKLLQKLLLINWHYFVHEVIEFKPTLNFLTGKTGSGKSTIIDALQVLILGDTTGSFFNKAANDQSRRTLKSYLKGEIAESEDEGMVYLRKGENFSSYIVGEFYDIKGNNHFCLGVVFDNYSDGGKEEHRYFYLNGELPAHHFIFDNTPMHIKALREWAYQKVGRKNFEYYDSNTTYRDHFRHFMGGLGEKFFSVFRKAVPFSPIMDIKGFISDFVCNVSNQVEITDMRENIRYYKQLEGELELVKRRITAFESIEKQFNSYNEVDKRLEMQRFLVDRAAQESVSVSLEESRKHQKNFEKELVDLEGQLQDLEKLQTDLESAYLDAVDEKSRCQAQQQKNFLEQQLVGLKDKLEKLNNNQQTLASYLKQYSTACQSLKEITNSLLPFAEKLKPDLAAQLTENFWLSFQRTFQETLEQVRQEHVRLKDQLEQARKQVKELRGVIHQLKQGIKAYDKKLLSLIDVIVTELSNSRDRVQPQVFADLLEIRDPKWRDAIEGYLHTQKFYLLIEPEHFIGALKVYDRLKYERGFYDLGLVDIEKLLAKVKTPLPGSLAEEIETDNPYARAYADYLLGRVMKVERVEDLRLHPVAITPTCMLYQNYVARQLNPQRYAVPYIGQKAIETQIQLKEAELRELEIHVTKLIDKVEKYGRWSRISDLREDDQDRITQYTREINDIPLIKKEIGQIIEDLGRLDLSKVLQLDEKIKKIREQQDQCSDKWKKINIDHAKIQGDIDRLERETIPGSEYEFIKQERKIVETYSSDWLEQIGEPRFYTELKRLGQPEKVHNNFSNQLARTESQREEKYKDLVKLRGNFNLEFRGTLDVTATTNTSWSDELQRLIETCLPEYEEKIKGAKEKAQWEFQEDFISKLKQNIELVREQIDELNKALKDVPFGRNRYRFKMSPNPRYKEYYEMIMDEMLMQGFSLFSNEFQARYQPIVEQLFNQIVSTAETELSPEQREELEENLKKFTDYRTYLDFDLLDIDEEGRESRLSRTISKKSGGETQTPFYIAVLASFLQTYRVYQTNYNNTLRLLVFDEAYSKMDHQRIQESVKLLRDVGLQVIISAPTEKIGDIAPYMDRNLCVTRVRQKTVVKAFDPRELD